MTAKKPPNYRDATCCGTCAHWEWGYEGEGECRRYPDDFEIRHFGDATSICADWQGPSPTTEGPER